MEERNDYIITYINEYGETVTYETKETEKEMRARILCYRQANYKIKKVLKKVVQVMYVDVAY